MRTAKPIVCNWFFYMCATRRTMRALWLSTCHLKNTCTKSSKPNQNNHIMQVTKLNYSTCRLFSSIPRSCMCAHVFTMHWLAIAVENECYEFSSVCAIWVNSKIKSWNFKLHIMVKHVLIQKTSTLKLSVNNINQTPFCDTTSTPHKNNSTTFGHLMIHARKLQNINPIWPQLFCFVSPKPHIKIQSIQLWFENTTKAQLMYNHRHSTHIREKTNQHPIQNWYTSKTNRQHNQYASTTQPKYNYNVKKTAKYSQIHKYNGTNT